MTTRYKTYAAMLLGVVLVGALANLCTYDWGAGHPPATAEELNALRLSRAHPPLEVPEATNILTQVEER